VPGTRPAERAGDRTPSLAGERRVRLPHRWAEGNHDLVGHWRAVL